MKRFVLLCCLTSLVSYCGWAADSAPLYQNDFEKAEPGKLPQEFLVLDGAFTVEQQGTNKVLELPGAPLDSFGLLFGPTEKDGIAAYARIYGTHKGRRYPVFALGLNGLGGYKLQVNPAKRTLELMHGDAVKTSVPYTWESGKWTHLRLQAVRSSDGHKIEGKAWNEGAPEPDSWTISTTDKDELAAGRAGLFASPFSGTPILFDDLLVTRATASSQP